ncbi:DoxX family protein [Aureisphaera galaxeae]|uniref:DoxX family protein n=1 Tax=Aureisphaera galaxeae TaxID=1538023 RepID=UPI0023501872|nr:DoxX family protein [Aureisphaera galaxeae]MDC8004872.1 DoxX family protein [Aureisphaera galaxeae]
MGTIKSLNKWANAHSYYPLDVLRIALGAFLVVKGFNFMGNTLELLELIKPMKSLVGEMIAIHYVVPAHFIGGLLIVFGLLTRWACIAQLPILIGAVLINFAGEMVTSNLVLAGIALLLCVFFTFYGSGKRSMDKYLKMYQ